VNASSERAAIQSFVVFAQEIDRTVTTALSDDEDRVRFVLRNLEQWSERWMLVLDNYDDPESFPDILRFIPSGICSQNLSQSSANSPVGHGDVLITTRHQSLEQLGTVIEVPPMPTDEAVKLLLRGYSETNIDPYKSQALEIIARLGSLALAIDQAASYIQYIQLPIQRLGEFLPTYEAQRAKILQHTREHFWEYGAIRVVDKTERPQAISAFTTWEMSFQQLYRNDDKRREAAAHFLTLSAFLGPTNIGESLFQYHWQLEHPQWMNVFEALTDTDSDNGISSSDEELVEGEPESSPSSSTALQEGICQPGASETSRLRWDTDRFWHLINQAYSLSLLQNISKGADQEEVTLAMHPLIRDWLQLREKPRQRQTYTREGMDLVASSIKVYEIIETTANLKNSLLLHLNACLRNDQQFFRKGHNLGQEVASCTTATLFLSFYRTMGHFPVSETLATIVMNTTTKSLGKEHSNTLTSMANLASTYGDQGRWKEAEELKVQVMETSLRVLGQEHPDTLINMNNLASTYWKQGRWKEAEELKVQVMETRKRVLGQEHPSTLTSMANLASIYGDQGRWKEAEELNVQVVEMRKRVLGQEHLDTLTSMGNLASTYRDQGRWKEAEELEVQVIETRKRVLVQKHPSTLTSMANLASTYRNQGRWKEAEELNVQVMETRKRVLGQEHPDTLTSMANLASTYQDQGRWKEAEELNVQVMETRKRVWGQEHPSTLTSMANLASTYWNQKRWKESEELDVQVMETRKRVWGQEHPSTLTSVANLASTYWNQKRWKEAEELEVHVMETRKRVLGQEHPDTLTSMNNLALVLNNQGKYEQSKKLQAQVFQMSLRILGSRHPHTLVILENLLRILVSQSGEEEALDFVKHLLA
jgi:tetratricopeptide (TPR) repeat protein